MSRKMKGFFEHPFVVMTRKKTNDTPNQQTKTRSYAQQREYIINLKKQDIQAKRKQLEQNNRIITKLKQTLSSSNDDILKQKQKLQNELQSLKQQQRQKQVEIQNCQQIQSIDPEQFKVWKEESAKINHKIKIKNIKQQYEKIKQSKLGELERLKQELDDIKNQQKQLALKLEMLKGQQSNLTETQEIVVSESEPEEIPDTNGVVSEIARLKESIMELQQENINLINQVKQNLDSSTWSVKQRFKESKQKIQKQVKRLIEVLQKPDKQVFRKVQNPDKIAQPNNLILDYENRLKKIEDSLPEQLRQQRIFQCLKPLPWRTIKGITIQNNHSSAIHQKFERLSTQFAQAQQQKRKHQNTLAMKQKQIESIKQKISQYQDKIKQLKQQL